MLCPFTRIVARCLVLAGLAAASAVTAQITPWSAALTLPQDADRPLRWQVGGQWQHDDNVLRSSRGALSDHIWVANAGLRFDQTYSLQRLELRADLDAYRYGRSSALDFNAFNYLAAWHWTWGPLWDGTLSSERRQWVDRLGDASADGLIRRAETANLAQAQYRLSPSWRALAGVYERRQDNADPLGLEPDSKVRGGELGLRYLLPSDNTMALRVRRGQGSYTAVSESTSLPDFKEREQVIDWSWLATGALQLQGQFGYVARKHAQQPERDYSGWVGRLGAQWQMTGKTQLSAGFLRELAAYQSPSASYFAGHRLYLAPQWQAGAKTWLRLRLEQGQRDYRGVPAGSQGPGRHDRLNIGSVELQWQPLRALSLVTSLQRDERRSNIAGADYRAHILALAAQARF